MDLVLIILIFILIILIVIYVIFGTRIFYKPAKSEPISIYYSVTEGNQIKSESGELIGSKQKFSIDFIKLEVKDPFVESNMEFSIKFKEFDQEIDFFDPIGNNTSKLNISRVQQYQKSHPADYIICSSLFKNKYIGFWSQIISQQPVINVPINRYFTRTAFDTWEGKYFLDTHFDGTNLRDETYLRAEVEKIIISLNIPTSYKIENFDGTMEHIDHSYLLTKRIYPGESFNITLKIPCYENLINIITIFIPLIIGFILGYFLNNYL